jgi:glycosyltransferase involved in cell wall biosynthesis
MVRAVVLPLGGEASAFWRGSFATHLMNEPLVSVVIPTTQRPELVIRAIRSVLIQSISNLELMVVVDGPNATTIENIAALKDDRIRIVSNVSALGAAESRNVGAAHARGSWLAFLDDDDEWLPHKLERQLSMTMPEETVPVIVSCRNQIVTDHGTFVWPRRLYSQGLPLGEYLFNRRSLFKGDAFVSTASLLMARSFFQTQTLRKIPQHEDWDFLLRATTAGGARFMMNPEPLVIVHQEEFRDSLSARNDWRTSLHWIENCDCPISRRAYSGFCLTVAGAQAASQKAYSAFFPLLWRSFHRGSPTILHLLVYLAVWATPRRWRTRVSSWWDRYRLRARRHYLENMLPIVASCPPRHDGNPGL